MKNAPIKFAKFGHWDIARGCGPGSHDVKGSPQSALVLYDNTYYYSIILQGNKSNTRVPWAHTNQRPTALSLRYLAKSSLLLINHSTTFLLSHLQLTSETVWQIPVYQGGGDGRGYSYRNMYKTSPLYAKENPISRVSRDSPQILEF
jgi:hypothetical protein